jgi:hypothetical protein
VLDFMIVAYLQTAEDREAKQVVDTLPQLKPFNVTILASNTALAAIPARYALDRGQ